MKSVWLWIVPRQFIALSYFAYFSFIRSGLALNISMSMEPYRY